MRRVLGWPIPPKRPTTKTSEELRRERMEKVEWLIRAGFIRSECIKQAMLKVPREEFVPEGYKDYTYDETPLPIPGKSATISCPHSYPLFYEALELKPGDRFLEVGAGSGYGAAIAREVVGDEGCVVTIEIDPETYAFAKANLERLGYHDIVLVLSDGSKGYSLLAPYNKIAITATCPSIPKPLIDQLAIGGKIVAPVGPPDDVQDLVLLIKEAHGVTLRVIESVLYLPLRGEYGWTRS